MSNILTGYDYTHHRCP